MNDYHRQYYIDWLRIIATIGIFFRHCARFFNISGWHIKNNQLSFFLSVFVSILDQWLMPLFFILAAISAYYALCRTPIKHYIHRRINRLIIPLIPGLLILLPPQFYIEMISHSITPISFMEFLYIYFKNIPRMLLQINLAHLWFLVILFVISMFALPIIYYLKLDSINRFISRYKKWYKTPGVLILFVITISGLEFITQANPNNIIGKTWGSWSLLSYFAFYLVGYLLSFDNRLQNSVEKYRLGFLFSAFTLTIIGGIWFLSDTGELIFPPILRALNAYTWLFAIIGFGRKYLYFTNTFQIYANEAVLPFYILHQSVIVIIAFYMRNLEISILNKYILISMTSFLVIIFIYHFGIKQISIFRTSFGMKPIITQQRE